MLTARRCAVLGHPVGHSLSPLLHRTAYAELGLDWTYDAYDVTAADLPSFVADLGPQWRGLSLTMPLKRAVLPLLDKLDDMSRTVGAANTVLLDERHRYGANTDVPGLVAAVRTAAPHSSVESVVVLGGGATAASALAAAARLGARTAQVRARSPERAEAAVNVGRAVGLAMTVAQLDGAWPARAELLVSTVPAAADAPVPDEVLTDAVVVDVVYDPWPSTLLTRADSLGSPTATGVDVLVHQAVEQVELMTGQRATAGPLLAVAGAAVGASG